MARLIDADALKEKICNNVYPIVDFFNSRDYGMFWTGGIEKAIDEAPTIEAEPIRHGKWIEHHESYTWMGYTYWSCSECGFECGYEKDITIRTNYCPNCGYKMDLEEVKNEVN